MDFSGGIHRYLTMERAMLGQLDIDAINEAMNEIANARDRGGIVYTIGNGGSAATASHMVCDFAKGATAALGGEKFLFECLSDNIPIVTAIANDIGYDEIFAYQLYGKLRPEDLVIAISGSGNSLNIVKAVEYAKSVGAPVIAMTGYDGGKLMGLADFSLHVPLDDMQIVEDIHMMFDHLIMRVFSQEISGGARTA
jgi:D-sedoheptulose 7-phosphate isomerase